ncbi:6,7-dimethyl-8-ribityllumazine synthase [bacterium]|nr:6,7-dimethyl-8-ribityllumazine synthase [bacterium]
MSVVEGKYIVKNAAKFAIVAGRFNDFIVEKLIAGSIDCLCRHGVNDTAIDIFRVPGAFEIPALASKIARKGEYSAIICLGAVIRGETPHFDFVASEVSKGIANLSMQISIPIIYGVLTTDSVDQAMDRSGVKAGNKGFVAALDALEMADLYSTLEGKKT